jgi:demethylmenaquinone methyltransferase/2-methoxy-6-polyprenyl-1,4-benzoquinol methylase
VARDQRFARPSRSKDQSREFYNRISKAYDFLANASEHAVRERGERALHNGLGESVLEIGCGTGHSLVSFAKAAETTGTVCGVDISEGMVHVARDRIMRAGVANRIMLHVGDGRQLPYQNARFDAAFMSFALELFSSPDILRVLAEVRRVLRPSGRLGVVSMAEDQDRGLMSDIYRWLHHHFPHFIDCRPIDTQEFLRRAEFHVTETIRMSIASLPVIAVVASVENPGEEPR